MIFIFRIVGSWFYFLSFFIFLLSFFYFAEKSRVYSPFNPWIIYLFSTAEGGGAFALAYLILQYFYKN